MAGKTIININDILIDDEYVDEQIKSIDKQLDYLKKQENESKLSKIHNDIIQSNYERQIEENPFKYLNSKQMQAIDLELQGKNKTEICNALGISRNALTAWHKDDKFMEVLINTKNDFEESNRNYFTSLVPKALKRLGDIIEDDEAGNREVVQAIKLVLDNANFISKGGDSKTIHNQTQIIISPTNDKNVREIEDVVLDVDYTKGSSD